MNTSAENRITFIGGGNMARSLIGGLIANGWRSAQILACEPDANARNALAADFNIEVSAENSIGSDIECVVLAVKPQVMQMVATPLFKALSGHAPLVISIAAGIRTRALQSWTGNAPVVRCMPNTPALIGLGASGLFAADNVSDLQKELADSILSAVGSVCWVDAEEQIDAVTAVSGSGPAYFFHIMEAMEAAACELGLAPDVARQLVIQTATGAAGMAAKGEASPGELRKRVTSPGGTTAAALEQMKDDDILGLFMRALTAAHERSKSLSNELENS